METATSCLREMESQTALALLSTENCPNYSYLVVDFERFDELNEGDYLS